MSKKPFALAIMGPTGCGKSALGMALAQSLDTEIISVDSAAVFRGMDIGSAKPSKEERVQVPHHLIDLCDPSESYSAADFCRDATAVIDSLVEKNKTPLLVGGTMLYFKALLEGLSAMPATDVKVRAQVEAEARELGWPAMHAQLMAVDPIYAETLHPNHSQRIGRGLEVYRISGKTMSEWRQQKGPALLSKFNWLQIAIAPRERAWLHQRIETRFDEMLEQGFVEEVKLLYRRGDLDKQLPAVRAVGYRQIWAHLSGELNYSDMRQKGIAATRQLAKRQLTWLRSWPNLQQLWTQDVAGNTLNSSQIVNDALNFLPKRTI